MKLTANDINELNYNLIFFYLPSLAQFHKIFIHLIEFENNTKRKR